MQFSRIVRAAVAGTMMMPLIAAAVDKKETSGQMVDSGALGVFLNGKRIATETFSIQQSATGSVISSQFKTDEGVADKAAQSSELQLTPTGDIRKYDWKEIAPGKAQATVAPSNEYLMEHISGSGNEKPEDQPFMLPASTSVLDDYVFIHREVLIWRYLATACKRDKGAVQCPANQKTQFGAINPHQRSSLPLSVEFQGRDKVGIRGTEQEMNKFVLHSEGGDWVMWLDDQFKLQRILVAADSTEVVRD